MAGMGAGRSGAADGIGTPTDGGPGGEGGGGAAGGGTDVADGEGRDVVVANPRRGSATERAPENSRALANASPGPGLSARRNT